VEKIDMLKSGGKRLLKAALLTILIAVLFSATVSAASNNLTVHFIDVGQGDSELIQFNNKNVLIDGGEQDMGPRVESYLREHGVSSLDIMVATHPHSDHVGGLITVLNDTPVKQVLDIGQAHPSPIYETFLKLIDQKNIPYKNPQQGQTINLDPNLTIEVLNPPAALFSDDLNQNSIVLKVSFNKVSFLLMGDAGFEAENSILASGYNITSDILKVAHHGSSSASSLTFLGKVRPAISVIEVGAGNDYGHPAQETLDALQQIGSKIYRTDLNGNIVVTTDGVSYSVTTQKQSVNLATTTPQTKIPAFAQSSIPITSTSTASQQFVGSTKSNKYHYPSCSAAKKIKPENEIWFTSSEDARTHGYVPCGICHPP
jgi:competence protein ComEC